MPKLPHFKKTIGTYASWYIVNSIRKIPLLRSFPLIKPLLNLFNRIVPQELFNDMLLCVENNYTPLEREFKHRKNRK